VKPTILSEAFTRRAEEQPLQLARSLLVCFRSWASNGYLQNSFKAEQFTIMNENGEIYLVDGPRMLADAPLTKAVVSAWGRVAGSSLQKRLLNLEFKHKCHADDACPSTRNIHSCKRHGACEPGALGAPESRGTCRDGLCMVLSEKTHVFDVANRPWLLPFIAARASGADRDLLVTLIRRASAENPDDRPSFAELVGLIDRYEALTRDGAISSPRR
jgi:hypothetical protein